MNDLILKNYMEETVFNIIDDVLKDIDVCKCEKCKLDILAITLNNLPARYVVTKKGELYSKLNLFRLQAEVDIITAITKAAMMVKERPHH